MNIFKKCKVRLSKARGGWNNIVYLNKKRITIDYRPMVFYLDEMG